MASLFHPKKTERRAIYPPSELAALFFFLFYKKMSVLCLHPIYRYIFINRLFYLSKRLHSTTKRQSQFLALQQTVPHDLPHSRTHFLMLLLLKKFVLEQLSKEGVEHSTKKCLLSISQCLLHARPIIFQQDADSRTRCPASPTNDFTTS